MKHTETVEGNLAALALLAKLREGVRAEWSGLGPGCTEETWRARMAYEILDNAYNHVKQRSPR